MKKNKIKKKVDLDLYAMILCAIGAAYLIGSKVITETTNMVDITKPANIQGTAKNKPVVKFDKSNPITILTSEGQTVRGRVGEFSVNGIQFYSDAYYVLPLSQIKDASVSPGLTLAKKEKQQKIVDRLLNVINQEKHIKSEFGKHVRKLLNQNKYDELDQLARKLLETEERFPSGDWKLHSFYEAFSLGERDTAAISKRMIKVEKWIASNPDSYAAKITLMTLINNLAWAYRGDGYSKTISDKGSAAFNIALNETIKIGNLLRSQQIKDPSFYNPLITASNGVGIKKNKIKELARESASISPLYFHTYESTMYALLPRWGGATGEIEEFTDSIYEMSKDRVGTEFYFRAVQMIKWSIADHKFDKFHFDWNKIQLGFNEYRERYRVHDRDIHFMAKLACLFGDREAGKGYFLQTDGQWNHFAKAVWGNPKVLEQFKAWTNEKPDGYFTKLLKAHLEENYPDMTHLVKGYIARGGDINRKDVYGNALLHLATKNGQYGLVEILIEMEANVNLTNSSGLNPIHLAAQSNFREIAKLLIASGADISVQTKDQKNSAIFFAASNGFQNFVQLLLEKQPSLINVGNKYGNTPLHMASVQGHINVVEHLLGYSGLELNNQTFYGNTAVHKAVMRGHYEIVAILIKSGANLNIKNRKNHTALSMAREEGFSKIVTLLQNNNADDSNHIITADADQKALKLFEQRSKFWNKQDYQKAKALFLEALELNPNYALIYHTLANGSWQFENDLEQAERYMKIAMELDPFYAESYYWRGRINHMLNRPEVYKPMFLKYIELAPNTYNTKHLIQKYSHLIS